MNNQPFNQARYAPLMTLTDPAAADAAFLALVEERLRDEDLDPADANARAAVEVLRGRDGGAVGGADERRDVHADDAVGVFEHPFERGLEISGRWTRRRNGNLFFDQRLVELPRRHVDAVQERALSELQDHGDQGDAALLCQLAGQIGCGIRDDGDLHGYPPVWPSVRAFRGIYHIR